MPTETRAFQRWHDTRNDGGMAAKLSKRVRSEIISAAEMEGGILLADGWRSEDFGLASVPHAVKVEGAEAVRLFLAEVKAYMAEAEGK